MKPKFAITCIILLIVANLSVVYFRSCKEGFAVKKKVVVEEEEEEEEEDTPKKKTKKEKKDPCEEMQDNIDFYEYVICNGLNDQDDRMKENMRVYIATMYNMTIDGGLKNKCIEKMTEKERKAMVKVLEDINAKRKKGSKSPASSFGF